MSNLSVALTADVVDLQTKFAVAKAEVSALTSEMNKLAKQSAAGIIDPAGQAQLQQVAGDFLHAKEAAAQLAEQMKGTHEEFEGVGGALEDIRGKLSAAFEVTGLAVAVEGVRKLAEAVEELGARATEMHTMSEILGVNVAQFQAMQLAASEAGTTSDVFARAGERLITFLTEARDGSGAAVEKLRDLGLTVEQIHDPTFQLNDLLGVLRDRLNNSATSQDTMNQLIKDFGPRAALAAEAIKAYDGSAQGVAATMAKISGLSEEDTHQLHEMHTQLDVGVTRWKNWGSDALTWLASLGKKIEETYPGMRKLAEMVGAPGTEKTPTNVGVISRPESQSDSVSAAQIALQNEMSKQELQNIQAGVEAYKEGSAQKLQQLEILKAATEAYYGSDSDKAAAVQRQVIAQQRAYNEAQASLREEQVRAEFKADDDEAKAKLASIATKINAEDQYLMQQQQELKQQKEMADAIRSMEETSLDLQTHIYQERAKASADLTRINARETQQQLQQWKFLTDGMKSGFASAMQGILYGTESVGQAMRGIFTSVLDGIISKLAEWAAEWITNLIITQTANKTSAASSIAANSAVAATAAMASVAAIPFIGWAMAPEVGATTYAEGLAYEASLAAEGGFDVPAGMNPVTQLHQREMVLPAPIADTVRNAMGAGGGPSRGGGSVNVQFTPVQGGYGLVHMGNLADSLRKLNGRFALGTSHV